MEYKVEQMDGLIRIKDIPHWLALDVGALEELMLYLRVR